METFMSADMRVLVGLMLSTTTTKRTPTELVIMYFDPRHVYYAPNGCGFS